MSQDVGSRSDVVLAVSSTVLAGSFIFVFLRIISRGAVLKKLSLDDYLMVLAWILSLGMTFAVCYGTQYGLGRHATNIPAYWEPTLGRSDYTFSVLYNPALMAEKTSILIFYLTLAKTSRAFRWATIATLVVVNAGGLALTLLNVFQCRPIHAAFTTSYVPGQQCIDIVTLYLSSAPLNIITDLCILFLPMPILTGMRLPRKQKIILIVTFSFGIFVAAVDVVRIAYLQSAAETRLADIHSETGDTNKSALEDTDFPWYASYSFLWSVIEVNVGIMCASVPALKPLVSRFVPHMLRDSGDATVTGISVSGPSHVEMSIAHRVPSLLPPAPEEAHSRPVPDFPADDEGPMGMMDFLTTPDMVPGTGNDLARTQTALTNSTRNTVPNSPNFFGFVDMKSKKSMLHMTTRESIFPVAMVTVLFFIWGFEYGLLDVLNQQFQMVSHMSAAQTSGIHSAYYVGYFIGPWTVGRLVLNHWGFKACFSVGLSIYACGTLIFWPAAVLTSFPAYLITNGIVGLGLSVLEVSANPFIALCGPPQYAEVRLNFSQGVQAIGTVIAPFIADKAFFQKSFDAPSLVATQYAYLGIALFTVLLAVAYHYVPLPEASDSELEDASERYDFANKSKINGINVIWIVLALCSLSQFFYVGGQEINGVVFDQYIKAVTPSFNATNYSAIAHTAFAVSRFLAAALGLFIKPRLLLLFFYVGLVVFEALAMHLGGGTGLGMMVMAFFMEGPIFSLLYVQSLRGMGRHAKFASVVMTSSISGGSVFSPISRYIATYDQGVRYSLIVGVVVFGAGLLAPVGLSANDKIRKLVDPRLSCTSDSDDSRGSSTSSRASKALSFFAIGKRASKESAAMKFRERAGS